LCVHIRDDTLERVQKGKTAEDEALKAGNSHIITLLVRPIDNIHAYTLQPTGMYMHTYTFADLYTLRDVYSHEYTYICEYVHAHARAGRIAHTSVHASKRH
jgi:hypothetical protein